MLALRASCQIPRVSAQFHQVFIYSPDSPQQPLLIKQSWWVQPLCHAEDELWYSSLPVHMTVYRSTYLNIPASPDAPAVFLCALYIPFWLIFFHDWPTTNTVTELCHYPGCCQECWFGKRGSTSTFMLPPLLGLVSLLFPNSSPFPVQPLSSL